MFISTSPWQFGEFRAYELEKVFSEFSKLVMMLKYQMKN
jgi:hypothetical protein